jgi:beta-lactamase superfamily II metal-dependent hydrolase
MSTGPSATVIQVDMFDVQLGAALLIQFRHDQGEVVRVLADAGVDPRSRYKQDHVLAPLKLAMRDFDDRTCRLDLIIGTHYDADHLEGLVPIINDRSIDIVEAWMPPVANDTTPHTVDDDPEERQVLAKQLDSENGRSVLERYFQAKHRDCDYLQGLQRAAEEAAEGRNQERPRMQWAPERRRSDDWLEEHRSAFRRHIYEASAALGESPEAHPCRR